MSSSTRSPAAPRPAADPARGRVHSLARALSVLGIMSRTRAAAAIAAGRVSVNGRIVRDPNIRVGLATDRIAVDGVEAAATALRYLVINKPRGLVTTARDEQGRATVYDCLPAEAGVWLAPVGRLDKASEGLIFFTNDTRWAARILDPVSHLPKVYHVQVSRALSEEELRRLQHGVVLDGGQCARAESVQLLRRGTKTCWLEVVLVQGMNRQIRRMIEALGAQVLRLVRVAIGPVRLGDLPKGQSRPLAPQELAAIARALAGRARPRTGAGRG